jgi:transposase
MKMTRFDAKKIVKQIQSMDIEKATDFVLDLAAKGLIYDPEKDPSPTTPSGAIPVYKKPNRNKRHKKPGRKKGHPGKSREVPDHIDQYQEHYLSVCPHCGTPLKEPVKSRPRYVEEIPLLEPVVTKHTINRYWCPCCRKQVEPVFTEAMPNHNIGLRVYLYTAWLHYVLGISVDNLVKILNYLFHFPLSPGALTQGWQRLANLLKPEYESIGKKAKESAVLHADETGWRLNGITHWLWCFTNKDLCYYVIAKSRGSPVIKNFLGNFFSGILICDFWSAYNLIVALAKQRCFFHLFAELVKVDKRNHSAEWKLFRRKLSALLKRAVRLWEAKNTITIEQFTRRRKGLLIQFTGLIYHRYADDDCSRLCKRLKRHQKELFTFLDYEGVSPYNNHAEQQMRKPVIARKIIQQNRSDKGALTQAILMSIFRTAELQAKNPVSYADLLVKNQILQRANNKFQIRKAA